MKREFIGMRQICMFSAKLCRFPQNFVLCNKILVFLIQSEKLKNEFLFSYESSYLHFHPSVPRKGRPAQQQDDACFIDKLRLLGAQSQFFSRSYESILPTSLTRFLPSTRGYSPWRPVADICTASREHQSLTRIFKGQRQLIG